MNSVIRAASLGRRGAINYFSRRPFCVSFEITHCCNARCKHCHRGGNVDEQRASPARFAEVFAELKPVSIQISGGEPLLRKDVFEIVEALRQPDGTPYMIFVTNGALLTPDKFDRLRQAGVDAFSVSLDYPDERHDEFRGIPGLLKHLTDLIAALGPRRARTITFNCVVQSQNFRDMPRIVELVRELGVSVNFSPYTWLRTQDKGLMVPKEDLPEFRSICAEIICYKREHGIVRTTDSFFDDMASFFENESIPNCRAGERFLVVNPDATLSPCGLIIADYASWADLKSGFTKTNTCTYCHTCIRSSTENPLNNIVQGGLKSLFVKSA